MLLVAIDFAIGRWCCWCSSNLMLSHIWLVSGNCLWRCWLSWVVLCFGPCRLSNWLRLFMDCVAFFQPFGDANANCLVSSIWVIFANIVECHRFCKLVNISMIVVDLIDLYKLLPNVYKFCWSRRFRWFPSFCNISWISLNFLNVVVFRWCCMSWIGLIYMNVACAFVISLVSVHYLFKRTRWFCKINKHLKRDVPVNNWIRNLNVFEIDFFWQLTFPQPIFNRFIILIVWKTNQTNSMFYVNCFVELAAHHFTTQNGPFVLKTRGDVFGEQLNICTKRHTHDSSPTLFTNNPPN